MPPEPCDSRFDGAIAALSGITTRRALLLSIPSVALFLARPNVAFAQNRTATKTGFTPPNAQQRLKAIGPTNNLSAELQRAFDPATHFEPVPPPEPGGWLAEHKEAGQTFEQFRKSSPKRPDARRSKLYLVSFGEFDEDWSPKLADLEACASAFFNLSVKSLPPQVLTDNRITTRERGGRRQYLSRDLLRVLAELLPDDGFALVGITMQDLYPGPQWNYVYGQASVDDSVGIYSFARYDPLFWNEKRTPDAHDELLSRSLKVMLHETCHLFGMAHCIYFHCLMNGANNLQEADEQPLHLCPVCLRKLHHSIGFNVIARDQALLREYSRLSIKSESQWLETRLKFVRGE